MKKQTIKTLKISDGLFFKEDFKQLPKGTIIYIKAGKLILPDKKK